MKIKLLLLFFFAITTTIAQQPKTAQQEKPPVNKHRFQQILSSLGLNQSQTKAFKEAVKKFQKQRHQQNQDLIKQLKTILTPQQFERLKKLVVE